MLYVCVSNVICTFLDIPEGSVILGSRIDPWIENMGMPPRNSMSDMDKPAF